MFKSTFIIIVTYNGMTWIKKCLDSCANYPVIVVDNASTDQTISFIESYYPEIILLKQPTNLGFGQANNVGIRYALDLGAEHVFLLNQDAYLVDDVLGKLIDFQEKNSSYGIISPIHITGDKNKLDKNFSNVMLKEDSGQFYSDFVLSNTLASVYDVPFVNAAAWLISKNCLETVGGFDPLFFHYGEDDNYCQRTRYHDLKIGVLPNCYIIHDREHREIEQPKVFSDSYYKNIEKSYKVRFSDVTRPNSIAKTIRNLKKIILKLQLQTKFKRAKQWKQELEILRNIAPLIKNSRDQNVQKGPHNL